jgi:hypothetical protein
LWVLQFDFENVKSWKLVSHTGIPFYNIFFIHQRARRKQLSINKKVFKIRIKKVERNSYKVNNNNVDNLVISDLHVGAYIDGLIKTKDFSPSILIDYLEQTTLKVNRNNAKEVNIFCLGDLIESFTGLNHKTVGRIAKGLIGAEVIKFTAKYYTKSCYLRSII